MLLLLEWMAEQPDSVSLAAASAALGAPKSSVLNLLRMLVDMGYAEKASEHSYRLIRLPGEVGSGRAMHGTLLRQTRPALEAAVQHSQESGFVAVLEDGQVRYLCKVLPDREIRYDRDITVLRNPFRVSSGIVLLTGLENTALTAAARTAEAHGYGDPANLVERVAEAHRDGYAVTRRGVVEGAAGVAAPIYGPNYEVVAALNIAGPADRLADHLTDIIDITTTSARAASAALARRS
ncbi:IclR family transcriptional regulator domain-containing protein [Roseivivax sediminis]|uniref:IclR family transcriptional regulator domain-containing protein n=1 Tax=Roseivivax sediminis TaxID=936889 RepID=UPI00165EED45|nr:IclR family transcriptional regulator C-terminal domain-containing protein [Roseivivax sediminis]